MSIPRKLFQNMLGYGYSQIVSLVGQLALVPFFLHFWGTGQYANWIVITGIPSMLTLLDFGVSQTSATRATLYASKGEWPAVTRVIQTTLVFSLCISLFVACAAAVSTVAIDWASLLNLKIIDNGAACQIILAMALYFGVGLTGNVLDGWFRAIDRTAVGAFLLANRRMLDILTSIVVLVAGGGPVAMAVAMLVTQAIALVVLTGVAVRWTPFRLLGIRQSSREEFRIMWRPALGHLGLPIAQVITLQGSVQFLAQIAPASVLVTFTMCRTLMRIVLQIGSISNLALRPILSREIGTGGTDGAEKLVRIMSLLTLAVSLCAYFVLAGLGPMIVTAWSHGKIQVDHLMLLMIGLHGVLYVAWFVPASYRIAGNTHGSIAAVYASASLLSLALWLATHTLMSPMAGASLLLAAPELVAFVYLTLSQRRARQYWGALT